MIISKLIENVIGELVYKGELLEEDSSVIFIKLFILSFSLVFSCLSILFLFKFLVIWLVLSVGLLEMCWICENMYV